MSFEVRLTPDAQADLDEIHDWIALHDSPARAAHVEDRIVEALSTLEQHPLRGIRPKELLELGMRQFRQIYFKPYRILYRVEGKRVDVYLIADGRRDMQTLLARRLLSS